ncbi:MAG: hypothetical protein J6Y78_10245 [Paludibacteraceae bacterium]|nr:hypothetical protein [Paludibacteraceae bacterium]
MAIKQYLLNESLERIDSLLKGYTVGPSDIVSGLSSFRLPIAVTKKYCIVVTNITYGFQDSEPPFIGRAYNALFNELYEIARGMDKLCIFKALGNKVVLVFDTTQKSEMDSVIDVVANMCGLVDIINYKCHVSPMKRGFGIRVAINYGLLTMVSYGEFRMNTIGDDTLLKETEGFFDATTDKVVISSVIKNNIKEDYQKFFDNMVDLKPLFGGNIINTGMSNWLLKEKK